MKEKLRRMIALLFCGGLMFAGLLSSSVKVEAGTSKTVENEKSYLFAVPEGGWTPVTTMADAKWDYFALYRNGKNMYYSTTTKNYASVSYTVHCKGGILTSSLNGHTLKMRLNTK